MLLITFITMAVISAVLFIYGTMRKEIELTIGFGVLTFMLILFCVIIVYM